jgi:hypothetical protein
MRRFQFVVKDLNQAKFLKEKLQKLTFYDENNV